MDRSRPLLALLLPAAVACSSVPPDELEAPPLVASPASVDFDEVLVGALDQRRVSLKNPRATAAQIGAVRFAEGSSGAFDLRLDRAEVPAGGSVDLIVIFEPAEVGLVQAELLVEVGGQTVLEISLRGSGTRGDQYKACVRPDALHFPPTLIGERSTLELTVCNERSMRTFVELLAGANLRRCDSANDPAVFCFESPTGDLAPDNLYHLNPGEQRTLLVHFAPDAAAEERASLLAMACAASVCETEVSMDGVGIEVPLECAPTLDFGDITPGNCRELDITCTNLTAEDFTVSGWGFPEGSDRGRFVIQPSAATPVAAGASFDFWVRYCPGQLGEHSAMLPIYTGRPAPHEQVQVELLGAGGGPDPVLTPEALDFGLVSLVTPARGLVRLHNRGVGPLELLDVVADGDQTGAVVLRAPPPTVLAAGEVAEFWPEVLPSAAGPGQSVFVVRTNDPERPELTVPLSWEAVDVPSCRYTMTPTQLDFGTLRSPQVAQAAVIVENTGAADCLLSGVRLGSRSDPSFSVIGASTRTTVIAPGARAVLTVSYAAGAEGPVTGMLELSISSRTAPEPGVPLFGTSDDDAIVVHPRHLDLGGLPLTAASPAQQVRLHNSTRAAITLDAVTFDASPASPFSAQGPTLPATIEAGGTLSLPVSASPTTLGASADNLRLYTTEGAETRSYAVSLRVRGDAAPTITTERFEQLPGNIVDVLFVVDQTPSLTIEHGQLAGSFGQITQRAELESIAYRIAVTTTDALVEGGRFVHPDRVRGDAFGGAFSTRFIEPLVGTEPALRFNLHVQPRPLSWGGSSSDAGLWSIYRALTPPRVHAENAGFRREGASLSVVHLTDGHEQTSRSLGAPSNAWQFYEDFLLSLLGPDASNRFMYNAITNSSPNCSGRFGGPSDVFAQLACDTGGGIGAVSADYDIMMGELAPKILGVRDTFFLAAQPISSSVGVRIDGAPLPEVSASGAVNWTFDSDRRAVVFAPLSVPAVGAIVEIDYGAATN